MAKQPKRKVLCTILAIFGLLIFLIATVGATYGRGFMAIVGRDKDFIRGELLAAHKDRKASKEIAPHSQKLEKSLGKFQEIINIMGMADMGTPPMPDLRSGGVVITCNDPPVLDKRDVNIATAMVTGKITVAEVEEIVEPGELDPDEIHTPGIFVNRIFKGEGYEKRIEQRTTRKRN